VYSRISICGGGVTLSSGGACCHAELGERPHVSGVHGSTST